MEEAPAHPAPLASPLPGPGEEKKRKYVLSRRGKRSRKALRARRANLRQARAAPKEIIYRPTAKRQAASDANLAKALAARKSLRGIAGTRLNALKHGVFSRELLEESVRRLGESEQEFHAHRRAFVRLFAPQDENEAWLVGEMADLAWRRLRLFHAQARREARQLQRILADAPPPRPLDAEETEQRAYILLSVLDNADDVLLDVAKLRYQIESLLQKLLLKRSGGESAFQPGKPLDLTPVAELVLSAQEPDGEGEE